MIAIGHVDSCLYVASKWLYIWFRINLHINAYSPSGEEVAIKKFSIGVRGIYFKRNEYAAIGAINSKEAAINAGLGAAAVTTKIFQNRKAL